MRDASSAWMATRSTVVQACWRSMSSKVRLQEVQEDEVGQNETDREAIGGGKW